MAINQQLNQKQSQVITLTPQLRQAIKLLEFSNLDLNTYLSEVMLENPLLAMDEGRTDTDQPEVNEKTETDLTALEDPDYDNMWTNDDKPDWENAVSLKSGSSFQDSNYSGLDHLPASAISLRDHLLSQVNADIVEPVDRLIACHLVENLDEGGYLTSPLEMMAQQLHCDLAHLEEILKRVQKFDPAGVFARTPVECIALQLEDRQELDSTTQQFLDNIQLFVDGKFERLMKICQLDQAGISAVIHKVRQCDPKPGLKYDYAPPHAVVPDVMAYWDSQQQKWCVRLNDATLPRLYVDQSTYQRAVGRTDIKKYLQEHLAAASWLMKALEQRSSTIYKVSTAIIEHQQEFLSNGIRFLKPLTLKMIAEIVGMHESTISRSTQSKYIATPRGMFELKYFFSSAIASMHQEEAHSAETVRHIIAELIAGEDQSAPYSDDQLVHTLAQKGIDIARRTIAKYREELGIPTSYLRKRKYVHGM